MGLEGMCGGSSFNGKAKASNEGVPDHIDDLIAEYHFKTVTDNDEMWYYDKKKGIFMPKAEYIIKETLQSRFGRDLTNQLVNEDIGQIQRSTYINREAFNHDISWLATKNCMVSLITGETRPFDPGFLCTIQIPVIYDHGYPLGTVSDFFRLVEGRSKIMKFLHDIMSDEDVELFLDFLAYCLWREYKFNFWMLFNGAGLNGKSVLLSLLERFLGVANVSGETLDRLLHNRFAVASLYHKLLNVDADISPDVIFKNTGILKKLTGNDLHTGEFKFKDQFKFTNYAKLIFSCNKIPQSEDYTDAFVRRIFIINFTQQFLGEKDDPYIIDKISTEEEFSGLFHELLERLPRILEHGLRKITSESMADTYDKYTRGSDPIKYFTEKALKEAIGEKVSKMDMYDHYHKFCAMEGLAPESDQSFSRRMSHDFNFKCKQFRKNGERPYCWEDVKLVDWRQAAKEAEATLEEIGDFSEAEKEAMK